MEMVLTDMCTSPIRGLGKFIRAKVFARTQIVLDIRIASLSTNISFLSQCVGNRDRMCKTTAGIDVRRRIEGEIVELSVWAHIFMLECKSSVKMLL